MFVMVCRTIALRVRSDALIAFEPIVYPDRPENGGDGMRGFLSKAIASSKENGSLISWADTGQWVTVERSREESRFEDDWLQAPVDERARREGHRFRIGFEPLFVDFTQAGSWFMAYSLVQVHTCMSLENIGGRYPAPYCRRVGICSLYRRPAYLLESEVLHQPVECISVASPYQPTAAHVPFLAVGSICGHRGTD